MSVLDAIFAKAKNVSACIVLAEGEDRRIQEAAIAASLKGLGSFVILGDGEKIQTQCETIEGFDRAKSAITIVDPSKSEHLPAFQKVYYELRKHKGISEEQAGEIVKDPLTFAGLMVREGLADGAIAGAVATTADTVRTAIQVVGKAKDASLISSCFLMAPTKASNGLSEAVIFSDCALVVEPNDEQLAAIGESAAASYQALIGGKAQLAFLSFSTGGSAKHPNVRKVEQAAKLLKEKRVDLLIEGDIQFDAAMMETVRAKKAPNSSLKGAANVFIFPNLDAGNIGYKIAQRIGGMTAIGPMLQGLEKPYNDLSRGCNVDDVIAMIAITACQAEKET